MGRHRFAKAKRRGRYDLWDCAGDRVIRHDLDWVSGARMVREGQARAVRSEDTNEIRCFQLLVCRNMVADVQMVPVEAVAQVSCVAISRREREAIAGLRGESRTAKMSEERKERLAEKARREGWKFEMDDLVERAQQKLGAYATTH